MKPTDNDELLDKGGVNSDFRRKMKAVLADVRAKHPELMVWEVLRTQRQQRLYYCQGRADWYLRLRGFTIASIREARQAGYLASKRKVTNKIVSKYHADGLAADCCWCINGQPTWEVDASWWGLYIHAGQAHELKSLAPYEKAHLQLEV